MSRTLILVKPDAFERALTGEVIARFERKGLRIAAIKSLTATEEIANQHYAEHTEKPFFGELVEFITGGPLVALVLEGTEAVPAARQMIGATNPIEAAPGSIRGDFALEVTFNMVHGSDSDESAEREIGIWFPELLDGPRLPARRSGGRSSRSWGWSSRSSFLASRSSSDGGPGRAGGRERAAQGASRRRRPRGDGDCLRHRCGARRGGAGEAGRCRRRASLSRSHVGAPARSPQRTRRARPR